MEINGVELVRLVAVLGGVIAMLGGVWLVFARLKEKQQGFGPNSLKALGLILFLPALYNNWRSHP